MDDLQQAVAKLRSLSPRLNHAVDQAQRVVQQVEQFLTRECQLAVSAEVPVGYNDKGVAVTLLRYGRIDGKFRIGLTHTDGDSRFLTRAWAECDRNEKLTSFPGLPRLLLAITKAVEAQISATTATSNTVTTLMAALSEAPAVPKLEGKVEQPKLTVYVRPEEALASQVGGRTPARRPTGKSHPDQDSRRSSRQESAARKQEEAAVG